jgi:hypothetical protein
MATAEEMSTEGTRIDRENANGIWGQDRIATLARCEAAQGPQKSRGLLGPKWA